MQQPLALRMRPMTIDDIVGQEDITYENSVLWKMVKNEVLSSIILYGPPGTGKTSIANVIANCVNADFHIINATDAGKKDISDVIKIAKANLSHDDPAENKRTILFIDEIHRFNKAQQDYLLSFVEDGTIILIGATTENPYFEVNPAIISRSTVFHLKPITKDAVLKVIDKALTDKRGLADCGITVPDDVRNFIADQANGDVRFALNKLEIAVATAQSDTVELEAVKKLMQRPHLQYDKDGDMHYDTISAFIKSMRGSDPDAVLYYLARMIQSGEDPKFIARRIMICASEDVGNADPMAIVVATSASLATERIGWPESQIILSQAALYVAMAPKSNTAYVGISKAMEYVQSHPNNDIPDHLRDAHYKSAKKLGHGIGYIYPHDYPNHWVPQQYLPDAVTNESFYRSSQNGYEKEQVARLNRIINDFYEKQNTDNKGTQ